MPSETLPPLYRASSFASSNRDLSALRRAQRRGELLRVRSGVFVSSEGWSGLGGRDRHLLRIAAAVPVVASRLVVSHESAAAMHGLPRVGDWPADVHMTDPRRTTGNRRSGLTVHPGQMASGDVEHVAGFPVTSLVRTGVDLALGVPLRASVPSLDAVVRAGIGRDGLLDHLDGRGRIRGGGAARQAILFADGRAQLPGESLCRVVLRELGAPPAILQQPFSDAFGLIGYVDFWWEEYGIVLEFDGDVKYLDARYRSGLSAEQIVLREKKRERRLLRLPEVRAVVRTDWAEMMHGGRLASALTSAGLPLGRTVRKPTVKTSPDRV